MTTTYGFGTTLRVPYEEALVRVKDALKAEGFGVLTEIDIQQTLREKLDVESEPELIRDYGVSLITVRQAFDELEAEGLIIRSVSTLAP